jgi:hypothetical protein
LTGRSDRRSLAVCPRQLVESLTELLLLSWGPTQVVAEEYSALPDTERVVIFGS